MTTALTPTEIGELDQLEAIIADGQEWFLKTGGALIAIRDRKLYRRDYDSFEAYCQTRWKFSARRALQLINSTVAVQALPTETGTMVPTERAAREVAKVPKEHRQEVVETAAKKGPVTAKAIATAAAEKKVDAKRAEKVEDDPVLDMTGWPIPEGLHEVWSHRAEIDALSREVAAIETKMIALQKNKPAHWIGLNANQAVGLLQQLHVCIGEARLHAVCTTCAGRNHAKCAHCRGKGILSKFLWDSTVPAEIKAIRQKAKRA